MGKVIYEDNLMQELRRMRELPDDVRVKVLAAVSRQPAADVAPVVRCKDCKHYIATGSGKEFGCDIFCGCYDRPYPTEPDDYCSYGERKDSHGAGG